jgi:predicted HicB family RNase H-like nuclease
MGALQSTCNAGCLNTPNYNRRGRRAMHKHWTVTIGVRVDPQVRRRLEALAKKDGVSLSAYIARIIAEHLRSHEK